MGLLGLRKFIDSCGCTRLLPVPVSDAEAEEEALRRLYLEGYREVTDVNGSSDGGLNYEDTRDAKTTGKGDRPRRLTSSSHVNGGSSPLTHNNDVASTTTATPVVDHVLVDMNCIVHSCFHHQSSANKTKKQLIQEVLERLRVLLTEVVVPRQSLSICFDGPAPIAKLQTQRLRRRKVALLDTGSIQQLNTLAITAGSLFMIELENAIASQFKLNRGRGFLRRLCPVYLYGTTVMGEGEAKISRALAFLAYGPSAVTTNDTTTCGDMRAGEGGESSSVGYRGSRGGTHRSSAPYKGRSARNMYAAADASHAYTHYHPDDSIVVLGNDIDLVVTCLGATAYHNFSIISPSSLQLIRVSDIIYRWLKATSATRGDTPFSPAQLPSIRIDFIFLFLLNGGDHYVGAGEVAMPLWKRYRSVRAAYPYSTLVSPSLDAIDIDFLADVVQASEYTGSSSVEVGMHLLQSALWSLYTVVTGVCPDYSFVPAPEAPQLCHLRAAAAHCQRTNRRICLSGFQAQSQPLTPLETYVALMPTEAALPKSVVRGLHSKPAHQSILKILETSNDTMLIAQAAKEAVEVSAPFLTTSEQYLRHFTAPVQLNVIPPRRRLSRHEQHRLLATQGHIQMVDPVPVVKQIAMAEEVPYMEVPYPAQTTFLDFYCPFDVRTNTEDVYECGEAGVNTSSNINCEGRRGVGKATVVMHVQGRAVSNRPSLHPTAVTSGGGAAETAQNSRQTISNGNNTLNTSSGGVGHKRVYLYQEEAARARQEQERKSAASKLQRTLDATSSLLQRGHHLSAPQERRMRRKLQRLHQAELAELRTRLEKEDCKLAAADGADDSALEEELRCFLGAHASSKDMEALLKSTGTTEGAVEKSKKKNGAVPSQRTKRLRQNRSVDIDGDVAMAMRSPSKIKRTKRERSELGEDASGFATYETDDFGDDIMLHVTGEVASPPRSKSGQGTRPLKMQKKQR